MIKRHCLHCWVFNETRQEMRLDVGMTTKWKNPFTDQMSTQWMAVCPRCNSIEYFFTRAEEPEEALGGLSSLFG